MTNYNALLKKTTEKLLKALTHLEYSYNKIQTLPDTLSEMDDEVMETWESFLCRFSRVSNIFITQYIRTKVAIEEPGYKGTTRDTLNKAEKYGLIDEAAKWVMIRELRNAETHEYDDEDLTQFYRKLKTLCPVLLNIRQQITT